jgi:hypothetical protein
MVRLQRTSATIEGIEVDLVEVLGERGARDLRRLLAEILASGEGPWAPA